MHKNKKKETNYCHKLFMLIEKSTSPSSFSPDNDI